MAGNLCSNFAQGFRSVEKIALQPSNLLTEKGKGCDIAGWGKTTDNKEKPAKPTRKPSKPTRKPSKPVKPVKPAKPAKEPLHTGKVSLMSWNKCRQIYKQFYKDNGIKYEYNKGDVEIYPTNICAGPGEPDACKVHKLMFLLMSKHETVHTIS